MENVYLDWIEYVKSSVPPEKLLIFNVKQGWEPLCKFLNVKVPETPMPRVNDTAEFHKRFQRIGFVLSLIICLWYGLLVYCIYYFMH